MKTLKNSAYASSLTTPLNKKDKKNLLISNSNDIENFASTLPSLINDFLHDSEAEKRSQYEKAVLSRNKKKYSTKLLLSSLNHNSNSKSAPILNTQNDFLDHTDRFSHNEPDFSSHNKKLRIEIDQNNQFDQEEENEDYLLDPLIESEERGKDVVTPLKSFRIKSNNPFQDQFLYNENDIRIPEYLIYHDFYGKKPREEINLTGWIINKELLRLIKRDCMNCYHLTLDKSKNLNDENFKELYGHLGIKILNLSSLNCVINSNFILTLISFRNLTRLNFSNSTIMANVIDLISSHCKQLREFNLSNVKGLTSLDLHSIAYMMEKYKNLEKLDISYGKDFKDESVLDILKAGQNLLVDFNCSHCTQLTTLSLVGLRNKNVLKILNLSHLLVTSTAYEWISEGCRKVEFLNISNNSHLDDATLAKIGKSCKLLKKLNINNCITLTDNGLIEFFNKFTGTLTHLNIEGCYNISSEFLYSIVTSYKNLNEMLSVNFNGLSRINSDSLAKFFDLTKKLKYFSMCSDLSNTSTNRHSSMPHISDSTFLNCSITSLQEIYLVGAGQITDIGFKILASSNSNLRVIDISGCARITDQSIKALTSNCNHVEVIRLNGCGYITDNSLTYIVNSYLFSSLKELQLSSCNKITNSGLYKLVCLPNLEKLTIRSCDLIDNKGIQQYVMGLKYGIPPVLTKKDWELVIKTLQQMMQPSSTMLILSKTNNTSMSQNLTIKSFNGSPLKSSSINNSPSRGFSLNSPNKSLNNQNYTYNIFQKYSSKVSSNYTSTVNTQIQTLLRIAELVSSSGLASLNILNEKKNNNIFKLNNNDTYIDNLKEASIIYTLVDWYIEEIEEKLKDKRYRDLSDKDSSPTIKKKRVITAYNNANTFLNDMTGSVCSEYQYYIARYNKLLSEINQERQVINDFKAENKIDSSFDDIIDNYLYNNEDIIIDEEPENEADLTSKKMNFLLKNTEEKMTLPKLAIKLKQLLSKNQFKIKKWRYLYNYSLKTFEITNLDCVTSAVLKYVFNNLKNLSVFNADGCSFNSREFNLILSENLMPFFIQYPSTCRTRSRELSLMNYNQYIVNLKYYIILINRIKKFMKKYIQINKNIIRCFIKKLMKIKMKKLFLYWYKRYKIIVNSRKLSNLAIIMKIQHWFKKYYTIRYHKKTLQYKKLTRNSSILIQKTYRGYKQLKKFKKFVVKLRKIKDNFFNLFTKYLFFHQFRNLKKLIIKLIYIRRGLKCYYDYQEKKYSIVLIQKIVRRALAMKNFKLILFNHHERLRLENEELRLKSINIIKKNYKNFKFNRQVSPFVLYCAIIYDSNYINMMYYIVKIQSLIRRYIVRKQYVVKMKTTVYYNYYLNKIKNFLLCTYYKRYYKKLILKNNLIIKRYKKFFIYNLVKLRLTKFKCNIIKYMRNYINKVKLYRAIDTINKFFYYIYNQKIANFEAQLREKKSAIIITRLFNRLRLRKKRKEMLYRQLMAAYKINYFFYNIMVPRRELKKVLNKVKEEQDLLKNFKAEKLYQRKLQKFEVFKDYFYQNMARKIQRWYKRQLLKKKQLRKLRKYKSLLENQTKDDEIFDQEVKDIDNISIVDNHSVDDESSMASLSHNNSVNNIVLLNQADTGIIGNLALALRPLKRKLGSLVKPISNIFNDFEAVDANREKRLQNSVLRYQVQTLKQSGIAEINITIGEADTTSFEKMQLKLKQNHSPYFIKVDQDLTNAKGHNIFFWILHGEDSQCINHIEFQPKPKGISKSMMKSRAMEISAKDIGRKLLWYPNLSFEMLLSYDLKAKRPAYVISDLVVVRFKDECDEYIKKGYVLCCDLTQFGFNSMFVLTLSRAPPNEEGLYPYPRLLASPWCDDNVLRVMKAYDLTESDIITISQNFFNNYNLVNNSKCIRTAAFFESLGYETITPVIKWISKLSKSKRLSELNFGEYLQLICSFIMFNRDDLGRFLFQSLDEKNEGFISKEKFQNLVRLLSENTPFNVHGWINQYEEFMNKKLNLMFVEGFLKFIKTNPGIVWQLELLQLKFMEKNLGRMYWDGKKEQFRIVRKKHDYVINH